MRLLILGGGFTGTAVARQALARGIAVTATTRNEERAAALRAVGVTPLLLERLSPERLEPELDANTHVLVCFPPDGSTDAALAPHLSRAVHLVYVSSTGVYGDATGEVDERTSTRPSSPRASARLNAEAPWRDAGAVVLRAPGIYGPGRGLHLRLARRTLRLAASADNVISRIHVEDLALALLGLVSSGAPDSLYVIGDEQPAPHIEVVTWLSNVLGLALPEVQAGDSGDESLKSDRSVNAAKLRRALGTSLLFPNYREGYAHCLRADAAAIEQALGRKLGATSATESKS